MRTTADVRPAGQASPPAAGTRSVEEQLQEILSRIEPLGAMELRLLEAQGTVLVEAVDILPAGARLGATQLGLLAALGHERVLVRPRPRVIVVSLSDGEDEAAAVANGCLIAAAASEAGALPFRLDGVPARPAELREAVEDQLVRADMVVIAGGVGPSGRSVVEAGLARLGSVEYAEIAMSPGGAEGFGSVGAHGAPVYALPGDATGAYVAFETFVRPAIRRMLASPPALRRLVRAVLLEGLEADEVRTFVPAFLDVADGRYVVRPVQLGGGQSSGLAEPYARLARCNALVSLPPRTSGTPGMSAGATAEVVVLDDSLP